MGSAAQLSAPEIELYIDSGQELISSGYSPYITHTSTTCPEMVTKFRLLNIEHEVIDKAIEIYYQTINTQRSTRRANTGTRTSVKSYKGSRKLRLMFYCVFTAYIESGYPVDPCYVAVLINMPSNEIDSAINDYSPSGVMLIRPDDLVKFYIRARISESE